MEHVQSKLQESAAQPSRDYIGLLGQFAPLLFLIALMLFFALAEPNFFSPRNLFNVMKQVSITGIIAIGMTFVILTGGIDLSVGSIVAVTGMVAAIVVKGTNQNTLSLSGGEAVGAGVGVAAAAAMFVGILCGFLQGLAITRLKIPAFVVTLGGLTIFRGLTLLLSNGGPISGFLEDYQFWGQGRVPEPDGVPVPVIIFAIFALLAHIILTYTRYGRHVYAVGGNQEAARLSGLNVNLIILSVYVIVGFFAGLSGFVLSSMLNSSEAVAGDGYELRVIAAVVIGGTSLFGGEGKVMGTVIGALLIGVLVNGLVLMNVKSYTQQIIIGLIIIAAVAFDRFIKSRRHI
jgi:ribose/xylose/arabinose/galactoside ABC-type transport system permease subunit